MKKIFIIAIILFSVPAFAFSQTPTASKSDEQTIRDLEQQLSQLLTRLDKAALLTLMADEFISTDSAGIVRNKQQELDSFQVPADVTLKSFDIEAETVRVFEGVTAIVTGRDILRFKYRGKDIEIPFRFTRVYMKRKGVWQIIAQHVTDVPPPPPPPNASPTGK